MAKLEILNAEVYCGTYGKYNAGSIDGDWMQLAKYQTNEEFLEACAKLHKDEYEPEFMFQDKECLPDEFYSESWIDHEIFQVLAIVKTWDTKKQDAFQDFLDAKGWPPDTFAIEEFLTAQASGKRANKRTCNNNWLDDETEEARSILKSAGSWLAESLYKAMKLRDGVFFEFEKPEIEKCFCFGYSSFYGPSYEEASESCKSFSEEDFKLRNLEKFDRTVSRYKELLEGRDEVAIAKCYSDQTCSVIYYILEPDYVTTDGVTKLTKEETFDLKEKYLRAVYILRAKFMKQIDSYLKRYGLTKIRKWTYCSDD
nr:MAG TPA: antirestriction protein [Caudoviricetes sp.]